MEESNVASKSAKVLTLQEYEDQRLAQRIAHRANKPKWEYFESFNLEETKEVAKTLGWLDDKVQVRAIMTKDGYKFQVEPFDDCKCRGIIKHN